MGDGYGPVVNGKGSTLNAQRSMLNADSTPESAARNFLAGKKIAVPGTMTSAFLALQLFLGEFDYLVLPFDQIFEAVRDGRADVGLIIHEGQLTYERSGFEKVIDLGEWWNRVMGLPLPLGGNVLRKDILHPIQRDLLEIIRESIEFGLAHRDEAVRHSLPYARDMNADLASKFIGMYVNEFTCDYGEIGRAAIRKFLGAARDKGYIDAPIEVEFVE
jgi:1,4-dihydroxy-6-naphthoate synthase